jgi:hypothetical protein
MLERLVGPGLTGKSRRSAPSSRFHSSTKKYSLPLIKPDYLGFALIRAIVGPHYQLPTPSAKFQRTGRRRAQHDIMSRRECKGGHAKCSKKTNPWRNEETMHRLDRQSLAQRKVTNDWGIIWAHPTFWQPQRGGLRQPKAKRVCERRLGHAPSTWASPVRAAQTSRSWCALAGLGRFVMSCPGRCPGLNWGGLSGLPGIQLDPSQKIRCARITFLFKFFLDKRKI